MSRTSRLPKSKYFVLRHLEIGYYFNFDPIKAYLESSQKMIEENEKELKKRFDKWNLENQDNPDYPDAYDIYENEIINQSEFSSILNESTFLTIYSMFEHSFFHLCERCRKIEDLNLGPKDLSGGNYIGQCRKFVTHVLNVNLDNQNEIWSKIRKYQLIRNTIAHNRGVLKDLKQDNLDFIEKTNGISYDRIGKQVHIDSIEFLNKLIDELVGFLIDVCTEIIEQKKNSST
ncbi:hypothetical protein FNJ87_17255 [Nonlabens mediterrranea]|uniref:Apea-like HEPN domain-containing protein n=1 Tax=Nonlabens mediterrranea TaxID=1419947 RepID=A0ABS0A9C5_9FLAO|nr:hypothetical protein [Nonlabens mediterrranea]